MSPHSPPSTSTSTSRLSQRLQSLHRTLKKMQPDLARVAVALYDGDTGDIHTYAYSSDNPNPLPRYAASLDVVPSLRELARSGGARVIDDMRTLPPGPEHTRALIEAGMRSSFTQPIRHDGILLGFIFFNSTRVNAFPRYVRAQLDMAAYAISLLILNEQAAIKTLKASLKTAVEVTHHRNPETGDHLKRMARYTRLIATALAGTHHLSDEHIEYLVLFSALHDIGKISIPDAVLLKPGKLTPEEFEVMKSHTWRGRELIDSLVENHALASLDYIQLLGNIVEGHHECWDGSGYPAGLAGTDIPLEGRIVAVADVFDALTNERPYKNRLSNEAAFTIIGQMRGIKLDPECVDVFLARREAVEKIRAELGNED